jgi:tellurite resistance protein TerC
MMLRAGGDDEEEEDYSKHMAYRFAQKLFPVWPKLHGHNFFVSRKQLEVELQKPENKGMTGSKRNDFCDPAVPLPCSGRSV